MKSIYFILLLISSTSILFSGCGNSEEAETEQTSFEQIDQDTAYELMQTEDCIILDVRTPEEYVEGHIVGAVNYPNEEIRGAKPDVLPDVDALILVYCRSGRRSKDAAGKLVKMGYTNIREFGGINTWEYETEVD